MICRACSFVTQRLLVKEWHSFGSGEWREQELADLVVRMLTEPVTRSLPTPWRGTYTSARAREWITQRDSEGSTLLAVDRGSGDALGLMILHELERDDGRGTDVRLGYLLAEPAWGRGIASELLGGFVTWSRKQPSIVSLAGGVEADNAASIRVLERNGFRTVDSAGDELLYRLSMRRFR